MNKDRFKIFISQLKTWRRGADGKIVKKNDHFPDALLAGSFKLKQMGIGHKPSESKIVSAGHRIFQRIHGIGRLLKKW